MRLLKLKICDFPIASGYKEKHIEAYLTLWQPDEFLLQKLKEGSRFKVMIDSVLLMFIVFPNDCVFESIDTGVIHQIFTFKLCAM